MAKQTTLKRLLTDPLLFAFSIAGFGIGVLLFAGIKYRFSSEQWATWVQAVGSMSAIWISLAVVQHQIGQQQQAEKVRDAKNDYRIASFAESVIHEGFEAIKATESAQQAWADLGAGYTFHDRSRIQAAQIMTRTLAAEPLFAELIKPVIAMHTLLLSVESASERWAGGAAFRNDGNFAAFWTQTNEQMQAIATATQAAVGMARSALPTE